MRTSWLHRIFKSNRELIAEMKPQNMGPLKLMAVTYLGGSTYISAAWQFSKLAQAIAAKTAR
uniref:Uncharacterized protein n=1 Tax=Parascaris equorum TaxID=6256 RepID=A0A914R365_PAREQ